MLGIGALAAVGAVSGAGIAMLSRWQYEKTANFIKNPGFEAKEAYWGSGYLEDGVRNLNHPGELEKLPYVVSPDPKKTESYGRVVSNEAHSGKSSFKFDHRTDRKEHHFGSLSQRIHGLASGRPYIVTFWAKGEVAAADGFFVTTDYPWFDVQRVALERDGWVRFTHRFNAGALDYADIRFVIHSRGTVWLDDVDVREDIE